MADTSNPLDGLEERLKTHSKAFESLLALTPAQEYYGTSIVDGRDPTEQWRAKKQSKAEKKAARKAKLDPANQKSALDIMKEREKKRKRELGMESDAEEEEAVEDDAAESEAVPEPSKKKAKLESEPQLDEDKRREKAEKRKQQRERKKEKLNKLKAKKEAKSSRKQAELDDDAVDGAQDDDLTAVDTADAQDIEPLDLQGLDSEVEDNVDDDGDLMPNDEDNASTASSSSGHDSPAFDASTTHSTASSSSSILPPSLPDIDTKPTTSVSADVTSQQANPPSVRPALSIALPSPPSAASILRASQDNSRTSSPKPHIPKVDQAILQERLRIRIEELRAKRKADGADGQPARSRQELLEQRRKKADLRKAHKKEIRRKAKEDEAQKQEERLRGSGSPLSGADIFSPRSESNNFSFSRLAFSDGSMADASLTKLVDAPKHKGPQDAKTALLAAENKQKRLAGLDEQKRSDIGEKDMWLNASKRTHGERVRDDQSLLKKALKRKEKQKSKSEREWQDREQAVVKGKEMKQKRRDDNLAKRRDEKGGSSSKKSAGKKGAAKKKRAGFEGRFKA